jgi:glutaredoxin
MASQIPRFDVHDLESAHSLDAFIEDAHKHHKSPLVVTKYFSDSCPHCVMMKDEWEKTIDVVCKSYMQSNGENKTVCFANIDVDTGLEHSPKFIQSKFQGGVPMIMIVSPDDTSAPVFERDRTSDEMSRWVIEHLPKKSSRSVKKKKTHNRYANMQMGGSRTRGKKMTKKSVRRSMKKNNKSKKHNK